MGHTENQTNLRLNCGGLTKTIGNEETGCRNWRTQMSNNLPSVSPPINSYLWKFVFASTKKANNFEVPAFSCPNQSAHRTTQFKRSPFNIHSPNTVNRSQFDEIRLLVHSKCWNTVTLFASSNPNHEYSTLLAEP